MSTTLLPAIDEIWAWLAEVPDPEIPVVSVTELGIIRDVAYEDDQLVVAVTPTYSGCPATAVIDLMIEEKLREKGGREPAPGTAAFHRRGPRTG